MLKLITFGIILSVAVICDCSCLSGTRRVRLPDGSEDCVFCKECPADQVVAKACSDQEDTICCPRNTFLSVTETNRKCTNCSVCPEGQFVSRQCSLTEDSDCTKCPDGFFTDASNSPTCQNCTSCKHGILVNCSKSSDTKCAVDQTEDTNPIVIIVVICSVIVPGLCAVCAAIYCRRKSIRKSNRKQKETSTKVESKEDDVLLQEVDGNDKSKEESPQECTTLKISTTNVENDAVLIEVMQTTNDNTNQQTGPEYDGSHICIQQNHLNVDKDNPITEHTKGSAAQTHVRDQSKGSEICKPSIGILYDTVVRRQWTVFVVGDGLVMTSIEAYECIKGARNGHTDKEKHIKYAHITFDYFAFSFKVSSEMFVDTKLGFVIMNLIGEPKSFTPMILDVSPLKQGTDYHTFGLSNDNRFQNIVVKLDRMDEGKISSMQTFLQKNKPTISRMRTQYCHVKTIKNKTVKLNVDVDDSNYYNSYCFSGTSGKILLGSPVCVRTSGQEPSVVGVCTRTIPWVYHLLDTTEEQDLLNEHAYILVTPLSDILLSITVKNKELSQKLFKSRTTQ